MARTLALPLASFSLALWGCLGSSPQVLRRPHFQRMWRLPSRRSASCPNLRSVFPFCPVPSLVLFSLPHSPSPPPFPLSFHLFCSFYPCFIFSSPSPSTSFCPPLSPPPFSALPSLAFPETSDHSLLTGTASLAAACRLGRGEGMKLLLDNVAPLSDAWSRDLRLAVSRHWTSWDLASGFNPVI